MFNHKQLMALAMNCNEGMLHLDNAKIPVKITGVEHDSTDPRKSPTTTFECLVVNEDRIQCGGPDLYKTKIEALKKALNQAYGTAAASRTYTPYGSHHMTIDRVIFKDPATIVFWADGTKTVVKCQEGDVYSKETGLALCIAKKALGNKGNFNNVFHEWIPEEANEEDSLTSKVADLNQAFKNVADSAVKVGVQLSSDEGRKPCLACLVAPRSYKFCPMCGRDLRKSKEEKA